MRDRCPAAALPSYESSSSTTSRVKLDCLDISRKKEIKGIVRTSPDLVSSGGVYAWRCVRRRQVSRDRAGGSKVPQRHREKEASARVTARRNSPATHILRE